MTKHFTVLLQSKTDDYFKIILEYDLLWEAVTSGRGTGRRKKTNIVKGIDPKLLKYGKLNNI